MKWHKIEHKSIAWLWLVHLGLDVGFWSLSYVQWPQSKACSHQFRNSVSHCARKTPLSSLSKAFCTLFYIKETLSQRQSHLKFSWQSLPSCSLLQWGLEERFSLWVDSWLTLRINIVSLVVILFCEVLWGHWIFQYLCLDLCCEPVLAVLHL